MQDEAKHLQAIWVPIGGAFLVGGFVVNTDWVFTVSAASPDRHLSIATWPLFLSVGIMAFGVYIIAAAMSPSPRLRLWGKAKARYRVEQREKALYYLSFFHSVGVIWTIKKPDKFERVTEWCDHLLDYTEHAWGLHERSIILMAARSGNDIQQWVGNVVAQTAGLIQRAQLVPVVDSFTWDGTEWLAYLTSLQGEEEVVGPDATTS